MRCGSRKSAIISGGLIGVVAMGYAAGRLRMYGIIPLGSLAAVILSVIALFRPYLAERIAGIVLPTWVVLAELTEQFAWTASTYDLFVVCAWLLPPMIGGVVLPAAGYWWSGSGCCAATFAGVAATTYSVHSVRSGAGLFFKWIS